MSTRTCWTCQAGGSNLHDEKCFKGVGRPMGQPHNMVGESRMVISHDFFCSRYVSADQPDPVGLTGEVHRILRMVEIMGHVAALALPAPERPADPHEALVTLRTHTDNWIRALEREKKNAK